jgi:hypothetical protein
VLIGDHVISEVIAMLSDMLALPSENKTQSPTIEDFRYFLR